MDWWVGVFFVLALIAARVVDFILDPPDNRISTAIFIHAFVMSPAFLMAYVGLFFTLIMFGVSFTRSILTASGVGLLAWGICYGIAVHDIYHTHLAREKENLEFITQIQSKE